jgi:hypothetical protein
MFPSYPNVPIVPIVPNVPNVPNDIKGFWECDVFEGEVDDERY